MNRNASASTILTGPKTRTLIESRYRSCVAITGYIERLFGKTQLAGRQVLEIGAGDGLLSVWMGLNGADVVSLEPDLDGSAPDASEFYKRLCAAAPVGDRIERVTQTFQDYSTPLLFDVVIMHNSINHLDEQACVVLKQSQQAREIYLAIFGKCFDRLKSQGVLIASDCARRNVFGDSGLRNPFAPDIEWHLHQQPETWGHLLKQAGFDTVKTRWNAMSRTGQLGHGLLSNRIGAYLTTSHSTLNVTRA